MFACLAPTIVYAVSLNHRMRGETHAFQACRSLPGSTVSISL